MLAPPFIPSEVFPAGIRRLFVLSTVEIQAGEPTPSVSTRSWFKTSQFHTFCRVLQEMLATAKKREDDIFEPFDSADPIEEDLTRLFETPVVFSPAPNSPAALSVDPSSQNVPSNDPIDAPQVDMSSQTTEPAELNEDFLPPVLSKASNTTTALCPIEHISSEQLSELVRLHQRVAMYFRRNNNIHSGTHHTFALTRFIMDENTGKTHSKELIIHTADENDIKSWFN